VACELPILPSFVPYANSPLPPAYCLKLWCCHVNKKTKTVFLNQKIKGCSVPLGFFVIISLSLFSSPPFLSSPSFSRSLYAFYVIEGRGYCDAWEINKSIVLVKGIRMARC